MTTTDSGKGNFRISMHSFIKAFEYIVKILACKTHDLARCFKILRENTQIQNMGSLHSLVHIMNPLHTLVSVMNFTICSFSESVYSKLLQMNIITVCYPRE